MIQRTWLGLRFRFVFCSLIFIAIGIACSWLWANGPMVQSLIQGMVPPAKNHLPADDPLLHRLGQYDFFVQHIWFEGIATQVLPFLVVLLSVGGVVSEKKSGEIAFTLSLPTRRSSWVLTRMAMVLGMTFTLMALSTVALLATGHWFGYTYDLEKAVAESTLCGFLGVMWIGLTAFLEMYLIAAMNTFVGVLALQFASFLADRWTLWSSLLQIDFWHFGVPWRPLLLMIAVAIGSVFLALQRFNRMDF
jgi:hypothetical protein